MPWPVGFEDPRDESEMKWVRLSSFIESYGYVMRARYRSDWVPSWDVTRSRPIFTLEFEDSIANSNPPIMDAVRVSDGLPIAMRRIRLEDDYSERNMRFLSHDIRVSDPRNHCIPLLDILRPPDLPFPILVMPRLLKWDMWHFVQVSEITDFVGQLLEGLAFMHEHNFAHFDVGFMNIMMDGIHLFTEPHHPFLPMYGLNTGELAKHIQRHQSTRPVKYYFIDFELSVHFDSFADRVPLTRPGAQDRTVPEEKAGRPIDPFAADVYSLGHIFEDRLLDRYLSLNFLRKLVKDMTQPDPKARLTASEANLRFKELCAGLSKKKLRSSSGLARSQYSAYAELREIPREGFFSALLSKFRGPKKDPLPPV